MKKLLMKFAGLTVLTLSLNAGATAINFDDIHLTGDFTNVGVYDGFSFSNLFAVSLQAGSFFGGFGPAKSGNIATTNHNAADIVIELMTGTPGTVPFSLHDVYFKAWSAGSVGRTVTVEGMLGGNLVNSVDISLTSGWTDILANFNDIDQLIIHEGSAQFLMDSMTVGAPIQTPPVNPPPPPPQNPNPVPEPAALALLAIGLFGISSTYKRRLV